METNIFRAMMESDMMFIRVPEAALYQKGNKQMEAHFVPLVQPSPQNACVGRVSKIFMGLTAVQVRHIFKRDAASVIGRAKLRECKKGEACVRGGWGGSKEWCGECGKVV